MKLIKHFGTAAVLAVMLVLAPSFCRNQVFAASSQVYFDSESYEADEEEEFKVIVTIDCGEDQPGTYSVELNYDEARMQYLSGADMGSNGVIKLQGTAVAPVITYELTFQPISGGNAGIYVSSASVTESDNETLMDILLADTASITIDGDDTSGTSDFSFDENAAVVKGIDLPIVGSAIMNEGSEYSIINLNEYIPEDCDFTYQTMTDTIGNKEITVLTDTRNILSLIYLVDPEGNFLLYSYGQDGDLYPCMKGTDFYYMSAYASTQWPSELTAEQVDADNVFIILNKDGEIGFYKGGNEGTVVDWDDNEEEDTEAEEAVVEENLLFGKHGLLLEYSGAIIFGIVVLCWIIAAIVGHSKRKKEKEAQRQKQAALEQQIAEHKQQIEAQKKQIEALKQEQAEKQAHAHKQQAEKNQTVKQAQAEKNQAEQKAQAEKNQAEQKTPENQTTQKQAEQKQKPQKTAAVDAAPAVDEQKSPSSGELAKKETGAAPAPASGNKNPSNSGQSNTDISNPDKEFDVEQYLDQMASQLDSILNSLDSDADK